ncbi:DUF4011 domain-containing protein [Candidatus Parabeggiatoa sp. HSG14]|uniref:DUF4011 domain-containing protein n=1 Tax=Candidatus Parabeggiatoa sp. HSG14 TaxID=3055593 RepID=UPI0025A8F59F|nr:DUF4011 domain-containing protein [Thiotrichales bacterium HSG14]
MTDMTSSSIIEQSLANVRQRLLDISKRNQLLNYKEKARTLHIVDTSLDHIFQKLVLDGKNIIFVPQPIHHVSQNQVINESGNNTLPSSVTQLPEKPKKFKEVTLQTVHNEEVLEQRCKKLAREARTAIEETGNNLLYLAAGFLEWYEDTSSTTPVKAPLILMPVKLERVLLPSSSIYDYVLSYRDEDIETNISLAEKLANDFNLKLPLFSDSTTPENYLQQVAEIAKTISRWQVLPTIRLDFFSFTKLLMYKDLDNTQWPNEVKLTHNTNLKQIFRDNNTTNIISRDISPLEKSQQFSHTETFVSGNISSHDLIDSHPLADKTPLILDADSSQQAIIMEALWTQTNLVVEGPPGTGKSQTITNLIAAALSQNKSVLFVAEKKAALDVVKSRLKNVGLDEFCLELHSHKAQKSELHAELKKRMDKEYDEVTQLERDIAELKVQKQQLIAYSTLVNTRVGPFEERIYEIFWTVERLRGELAGKKLPIEVKNPLQKTRDDLNNTMNKLKELGVLFNDLPDDVRQDWQGFEINKILPGDEKKIQQILLNMCLEAQTYQAYLDILIEETQLPITQDLADLQSLTQIDATLLTPMPTPVDTLLAMKLLDKQAVESFQKFNVEQQQYQQLLKQSIKFLGHGKYSVRFIQQVVNAADKLEKLGFANDSPDELMFITNNVDKLDAELQSLLNNPESVDSFLNFLKLKEIAEHAPKDLVLNKHPEHALEATPIVFQQVREIFHQLEVQWTMHKNDFLLNKLPSYEHISILADELRKHQKSWFPFLSVDYRRAKSIVKSFLVSSSSFNKRKLIKRLEKLAVLKQKTDQETQKEQYKRLFGPLFMGIKTDWTHLEELITWSQKLGNVLGQPEKAQELLATQADLKGYLLKNTAVIHEQWIRVVKTAEQLNVPIESHLLVNEFVKQLLERCKQVVQLIAVLQKHLPHLNDKHIISTHSAVQNLLTALHIRSNAEQNQFMIRFYGKRYRGIETNITTIIALADWIAKLQIGGNMSLPLLHWLVNEEPVTRVPICQELLERNQIYLAKFSEQCHQLAVFGKLDIRQWFKSGDKPCTLTQIAKTSHACQTSSGFIWHLVTFYQLKQEIKKMGFTSVIQAMTTQKIPPKQGYQHFQYAFYQSMAEELIRQHAILANFTHSSYENLRQRFVKLDKKCLKMTRQQIAYKIAQRSIPQGNGTGKVGTFTEKHLIEHELNKKRRHIPIRQLVRRSTKALQALKPCFMMSPLSVAQYLSPGKIEFDILIMDEASQIRPEDALGAIARCRQIVIVGDSKQLPPTHFFERLVNEEEEMTVLDGQESILDICLSTYRKGQLCWHYRSEHESLIAFSNHHFYDDKLVVFPAPQAKHQDVGVYLNYIENATYHKGRNHEEAEAVVKAVVAHFRKTPELSLGVATFNLKQQELISELLDKRCQQDTWLEEKIKVTENTEEPFFVKNLENVQGDERDIVFISTTYGPEKDTGRFFQRFGPISNDMGWRRLNVIFTRAKKRLELFTAMRSSDITLKTNSKRGVKILKTYLAYAETGQLLNDDNPNSKEVDNNFEIAISKLLKEHGYQTVSQVGVAGFRIDIGVCHSKKPDEYLLGIEYDGANYHATKSIRDRDRLKQEVLERKGWKIHRIWSTEWYKNREAEVERLLQALSSVEKKPEEEEDGKGDCSKGERIEN